jgi:hypothetical protein
VGPYAVQPFARLISETSALEQDMPYRNSDSGAPDDPHAGKSTLLKIIDVPRNRNDRCDLSELPDDIRIADIAGMENGCHPGKVLDERRIEEPMRIGDDSDPRDAPLAHGAATG